MYAELAELGGGGGRWFTGSPVDRFTCEVCHGSEPLVVAIEGLPQGGAVPGTTYEVRVAWPEPAATVTVIGEVLSSARRATGSLATSALDTSDTYVEITNLADDRQIVGIASYETTSARFSWTAPSSDGRASLYMAVVTGDDSGDPSGDRVGLISTDIGTTGSPTPSVPASGCQASPEPGALGLLPSVLLLMSLRRIRARREFPASPGASL
ncbi:MAG: hypothetical protein B7733_01270 [Myxococcales bacterium FL481]|nr:MAG: hypothetical protein B7733_01270 [Myxococcales bacterium FL481]